jgi:hypothetical protein
MSELTDFQVEDGDTGELTDYSGQTLVDAHRGVYGVDGEIWALEMIDMLAEQSDYFEENGIDVDQGFPDFEEPEPDPEYVDPDTQLPWQAEFTAEMDVKVGRLEKQIGRRLTEGEIQAIVADVLPQGHVPDLVEAYGPQLAARETDTEHTRRDLMTEEVEDAMDRDPSFDKEPREPENVDEARRAYMVAEMENAQAEEPVEA